MSETTRVVQVHYVVGVEMKVTTDESGNTISVSDIGTPFIDAEVPVNYDGEDTWVPETDKWRRATEQEWDAGAAVVAELIQSTRTEEN